MLQRLGIVHLISKKMSRTKRIWVHALSVGEIKSALPLVNALKKLTVADSMAQHQFSHIFDQQHRDSPHEKFRSEVDKSNYEIIITSSTRTGFALAQELFASSAGTDIQVGYFPFDFSFSVKNICSRVDPDLVIIVESDLWPGFLCHMQERRTPVFLVNARLSESSFNGYMLLKKIFAAVFSLFQTIMVQTEVDKARFVNIGVNANKVKITGNMKFDQPLPSIPDDTRLILDSHLQRRYLLAGSTHEGEEEILASVFIELKQNPRFHDLVLIVTPRDPQRSLSIKNSFNKVGLNCQLLSYYGNMEQYFSLISDRFNHNTESVDILEKYSTQDVLIVDKMGILAGLYSICDIAFIGGSLFPFGGHNPLEPSLFAKPVIFGTHMDDFKEISDTMLSNGAAFTVKDEHELLETITMLLDDKKLAKSAGQSARKLVENGKGSVERILSVILQNSSCFIKSSGEPDDHQES